MTQHPEQAARTDLEQLWYTWSLVGLSSFPGLQVRAASQGLRGEQRSQLATIEPYLQYRLPAGVNPLQIRPTDAPVALALIDTGAGRILVRRQYIGRDAHNRPGNFFTHAITGFTGEFTALDAVGTWAWPFWDSSDERLPASSTDLDAIPAAPFFETISTQPPPAISAADRADLELVVRAYLRLQPDERLVLVAPPPRVVTLVTGLSAALPHGLRRAITFSTYEADASRATTRIVGTSGLEGQGPGRQLAAGWAAVRGVLLDLSGGRVPDLPAHDRIDAYAAYAAAAVQGDGDDGLRTLLRQAEAVNVSDVDRLLLVFSLQTRMSDLSDADVQPLLEQGIVPLFMEQEKVRAAIVRMATRSQDWWDATGRAALETIAVTATPDTARSLAVLAQEAAVAAGDAVVNGDAVTARRLFDGVVRVASPASTAEAAATLMQRGSPHFNLPWECRQFVIDLACEVMSDAPAERLGSWLHVRVVDLSRLLACKLSTSWEYAAIEYVAVRTHGPRELEDVAGLLLDRPATVTGSILQRLIRAGQEGEPALVRLVKALAACAARDGLIENNLAPSRRRRLADVLYTMLARPELPDHLAEELFGIALDQPELHEILVERSRRLLEAAPSKERAHSLFIRFFQHHKTAAATVHALIDETIAALVPLLAHDWPDHLEYLAERYIATMEAADLRRRQTSETLVLLKDASAHWAAPTARLVTSMSTIVDWLVFPHVRRNALNQLRSAIEAASPRLGKIPLSGPVDRALRESLVQRLAGLIQTTENVYDILETLSWALARGADRLYEQLFELILPNSWSPERPPDPVAIFACLRYGLTGKTETREREQFHLRMTKRLNESLADEVLAEARRSGGPGDEEAIIRLFKESNIPYGRRGRGGLRGLFGR